MNKTWDVVIIGGGLSGYVAANFLAKTNLSVLILEKGKKVGGRARTDIVQDQYFNLGPHAFYQSGKARATLEELGIFFEGKAPQAGGLLIENMKFYSAPFSPIGLLKSKLLNLKDRFEWITSLTKIKQLNPDDFATLTFQEWLSQTAKSEHVQLLLSILARLATYCHAPEKASAKVILSHLQHAMKGVVYLDGGWQTIIDQLHNQAVISGVQIHTESNVKQIEKNEIEPFQLTLSTNEIIQSKQVLYTGSPHELNKIVADCHPQRNFFDQLVPIKAATLDVALKKLPNPNHLFALGVTEPYYYSVHSNYAQLSKDRQSTILHVLKYHHPDEKIDVMAEKSNLEKFLDMIQPGWRNYVITCRCLPNITVSHRLPLVGDERELTQSETHMPGLFIAGDWASPNAILSEGAVESGKQAAKEISRKNEVI